MIQIFGFYKFIQIPSEELTQVKEFLIQSAHENEVFGLLILGTEGINATISGKLDSLNKFIQAMEAKFSSKIEVKLSESDSQAFKNFKVKIRDEIVSLGRPDIVPTQNNHHLSPEEWDRVLKEEDVIVLDTRNWYETQIGKFKNAIDPKLNEFNEFPEYLKKAELPKDKKILIYCTGGIRCEKAIYEMQEQGYEQVYQLDGGILKYLEKFPEQEFDGECFVFDQRIAVDQHLKPSQKYKMCPHCGQPAEIRINCIDCEKEALICEECYDPALGLKKFEQNLVPHAPIAQLALDEIQKRSLHTCSKNCRHHFLRKETSETVSRQKFTPKSKEVPHNINA